MFIYCRNCLVNMANYIRLSITAAAGKPETTDKEYLPPGAGKAR